MHVRYQMFEGGLLISWETLFQQVAEFPDQIDRDRLISISHSEDQNRGVVVVWYWSSE